MNPVLSIIVPIYNVRPYLCECLDSILSQPFCDYELILVDDGSTDGSGAICDDYATKDQRIIVIHKDNGGLSSARNAGLDAIKGKYVSFIDSDDYLLGDYYSDAIRELETNPAIDYVWLLYKKSSCDGSVDDSQPDNPHPQCIITKDDGDLLRYVVNHEAFAWIKIYKKELFDDIRYPVGMIMEDLYVVPQLYEKSRACLLLDKGLLIYRQRPRSIVHIKHTPKMMIDIATAYIKIIELCKKYNQELYIEKLATYSSGILDALVLFPDSDFSDIERKYQEFDYSLFDVVSSSISMIQKMKLILLKYLGYQGFLYIYKRTYSIRH